MKTVYPIIYGNGEYWMEDWDEVVVLVTENLDKATKIVNDLNTIREATTKEKMNAWNEKYGRVTGYPMDEPYPTESSKRYTPKPYFKVGDAIKLI